jgi:TonB family protein
MLATPQPRPAQPGYRAQKEQTKIEGSISNRGRPGVDAIGTPLGRYRKAIADAIGSRWYYYVNQRMDLITVGDVHIKFVITRSGRVEGVKILSNTANATFGEFCMRSVTEAKIPPLPPDVSAKLDDGRLEIEYHFTIYPQ